MRVLQPILLACSTLTVLAVPAAAPAGAVNVKALLLQPLAKQRHLGSVGCDDAKLARLQLAALNQVAYTVLEHSSLLQATHACKDVICMYGGAIRA
jgi:hypothetical protein